jgi:hypothetical protein
LALRARHQSVREILEQGPFEFGMGPRRARVWRLSARRAPVGRAGTATRPTQKQRILAVLGDGRWHTAAELYRTGCVLHSRISDLRREGYRIERRHVGGVGAEAHEYRLSSLGEAVVEPQPATVSSSDAGRIDGLLSREQEAGVAQLTLIPAKRGAYDEAAA